MEFVTGLEDRKVKTLEELEREVDENTILVSIMYVNKLLLKAWYTASAIWEKSPL